MVTPSPILRETTALKEGRNGSEGSSLPEPFLPFLFSLRGMMLIHADSED